VEDAIHAMDAVYAVGVEPPLFAVRPRILPVVRMYRHAPFHRTEGVFHLLGRLHRAGDYRRGIYFQRRKKI